MFQVKPRPLLLSPANILTQGFRASLTRTSSVRPTDRDSHLETFCLSLIQHLSKLSTGLSQAATFNYLHCLRECIKGGPAHTVSALVQRPSFGSHSHPVKLQQPIFYFFFFMMCFCWIASYSTSNVRKTTPSCVLLWVGRPFLSPHHPLSLPPSEVFPPQQHLIQLCSWRVRQEARSLTRGGVLGTLALLRVCQRAFLSRVVTAVAAVLENTIGLRQRSGNVF